MYDKATQPEINTDQARGVTLTAVEVELVTEPASVSINIKPVDKRCKFWAKVVRNGGDLLFPSRTLGANDIPHPYHLGGLEELMEGDIIFKGEANHHIKARVFVYNMGFVRGGKLIWVQPSAARKAAMKAAGLDPKLLSGAGDVAGMVRMAWALRQGIDIGPIA